MLQSNILNLLGRRKALLRNIVSLRNVRYNQTDSTKKPVDSATDAKKENAQPSGENASKKRSEYFINQSEINNRENKIPPPPPNHGKPNTLALIFGVLGFGGGVLYLINERRSKSLVDTTFVSKDRPPEFAHLSEPEYRAQTRVKASRERRRTSQEAQEADSILQDQITEKALAEDIGHSKPPVAAKAAVASVVAPAVVETPVVVEPVIVEEVKAADVAAPAAVVEEPFTIVEEVPAKNVKTMISDMDSISYWEDIQRRAADAGSLALQDANTAINSLGRNIMTRISEHEIERQNYLNKLRYNLENGTGGSERLVQLLEQRDETFFSECTKLIENYTKQAIKAAQISTEIAQAEQSNIFAQELSKETQRIKDLLTNTYQRQMSNNISDVENELTIGFETQIGRLSMEHTRNMEFLTDKYTKVLDELSEKIQLLNVVMDLHTQRRLQSDSLQHLSIGLIETERLVDKGEPLVSSWTSLQLLSYADPVIKAAIATVPQTLIHSGAPPIQHLQRRFETVENAARCAMYLPPKTSFIAHIFAFVFGKATVKEASLVNVPHLENVESYPNWNSEAAVNDVFFKAIEYDQARLSRAGFYLNRGNLVKTVEELENIQNPNVKSVCQGFLAQTRERIVIDQALLIMRNHAKALYKDMFN